MKTNKNKRWIGVFDEITNFMETNLEKWNSIEEIRKTYDDFVSNLKKIKEIQPELERDLSPVKKELAKKKDLLLQRLFPVRNILEVYAEDHNIGKKGKSIATVRNKLETMAEGELLEYASRLHRLIDEYMHGEEKQEAGTNRITPGKDIQRYGLTQSMMDGLHSAIHQYQSAFELRTDVSRYRKRMKKKSGALIRANRRLLTKRLDKLMSVFSGTHPSFFKAYMGLGRK